MKTLPQNTILIVDDNSMCVSFLVNTLKGDYNLLIAKDGHKAINIAIKSLPDLILSDIDMPGMTGYELLSTLKDIDATKNISTIFFTSRDREEEKTKGLQLGAVDYIPKGTFASIVKDRVQAQINRINMQ